MKQEAVLVIPLALHVRFSGAMMRPAAIYDFQQARARI
jgi:hypothetical protein